jgi:hypothetical protein
VTGHEWVHREEKHRTLLVRFVELALIDVIHLGVANAVNANPRWLELDRHGHDSARPQGAFVDSRQLHQSVKASRRLSAPPPEAS